MSTNTEELFTTLEIQGENDRFFLPLEEPADPNKKAHIVNPPMNLHIWKPGMDTQHMVDLARIRGIELVALCQYKWVPTREPGAHDTCMACLNIAQQMIAENGF